MVDVTRGATVGHSIGLTINQYNFLRVITSSYGPRTHTRYCVTILGRVSLHVRTGYYIHMLLPRPSVTQFTTVGHIANHVAQNHSQMV